MVLMPVCGLGNGIASVRYCGRWQRPRVLQFEEHPLGACMFVHMCVRAFVAVAVCPPLCPSNAAECDHLYV